MADKALSGRKGPFAIMIYLDCSDGYAIIQELDDSHKYFLNASGVLSRLPKQDDKQ